MGQITRMTMDLNSKSTGFNMSIQDMTVNEINILVGTNGSGKSFVLRQSFILGFVAKTYHQALISGIPFSAIEWGNYVVSKTLTDPDFTGNCSCYFDNGVYASYDILDGKVTKFDIVGMSKDTKVSDVKFLSAGMRTFDDISAYLRMRKRIVPELNKVLTEEQSRELCDEFKIYEVIQIESMINNTPIEINGVDFERYGFTKALIPQYLDVDLEKCDFFAVIPGNPIHARVGQDNEFDIRYMRTYSKGEQSLVNMFSALSF